jgi:molybdopterin-guanine dinucleotide biosynthesis protein A
MGFPKYLLPVGGRTIIENTIEILEPFFEELLLVTDNRGRFLWLEGITTVEDLVRGCGPLGGIYTGLKAMSNQKGFFVACDMPFLHNGPLERVLTIAQEDDNLCVVPLVRGRIEPLHAVYSKQLLPHIERALSQGKLSLKELFRDNGCRYVRVEESEVRAFTNINTPEDLKDFATKTPRR